MKIEKISQGGRLNSLWKKQRPTPMDASWEMIALANFRAVSSQGLLQQERRKMNKSRRRLHPSLEENYWLNANCGALNEKL